MHGERVLVACSGGRDSLALASVLNRISTRSHFALVGLVYVDHGPSSDKKIVRYREKAAERVRAFALERNLEFIIAGPAREELESEESLRDFRHQTLNCLAEERKATAIAFAHHADDLLETRLIRLMRGTGARGIEAMRERRGLAWRPFLRETRSTISTYVSDQGIEWVEDPTNAKTESLRNWIRLELLPRIEAKRPGSARAMARSFDLLTQEIARAKELDLPRELPSETANLDRASFESLSLVERKRALTRYASELGARDLTSGQVEEVIKRLNGFEMQRRRFGAFNVAGLEWHVNSKQIVAKRVASAHVKDIH